MAGKSVKICSRCVLPDDFPGIRFDESGVCSYCRAQGRLPARKQRSSRFDEKFSDILEEIRGRSAYDVLVAYSGGKDSSFTLKILKERYRLKPLGLVVDHGFVSDQTMQNIRRVSEALDVDLMIFRPGTRTLARLFTLSMEREVYPVKALERASAVCNSCMNLVKSLLLRTAIEKRIPLVAYGWSPGQAPLRSSVFKTNAPMLREMQKAVRHCFEELVGGDLEPFLLDEEMLDPGEGAVDPFPYIVHPLAFLPYDEKKIVAEVESLGWVHPRDTGAHSSNCLLNDYAIAAHVRRHGFHPYALEIAGLVRDGFMTREEGLSRLEVEPDAEVVEYVDKKLAELTKSID